MSFRGAPCEEGSPASPGTRPIPVLISIQSEVVQKEEDLPPHAISVLLVLKGKQNKTT